MRYDAHRASTGSPLLPASAPVLDTGGRGGDRRHGDGFVLIEQPVGLERHHCRRIRHHQSGGSRYYHGGSRYYRGGSRCYHGGSRCYHGGSRYYRGRWSA